MATETQKNFRKQMSEIAKSENNSKKPEVISYINKGFTSNRVNVTRKRIISLSGVIAIIIFLLYASPIINSVYGQIEAYKQKPIVEYLEKIKAQDNKENIIYNSIIQDVQRIDMKSSSSKKTFINNMTTHKVELQQIVAYITAIDTPKEAMVHSATTINAYNIIITAIDQYIEGVTTNNQTVLVQGQVSFQQFLNANSQKRLELMKLFDKTKIKYQLQPDGTLRYWYKTLNNNGFLY